MEYFENNENKEIEDTNETTIEEFLNEDANKDKIKIEKKPQRTVFIEKHDNNSGMGDPAPYSISKYYNWGACLFNWIWAIRYKKYPLLLIPLLLFLPYGFIPAILCCLWVGTKGNQWAWEEVAYENEEDFHKTQKTWVKAWFICAVISGIIGSYFYFTHFTETKIQAEETLIDTYDISNSLELSIPEDVIKMTESADARSYMLTDDKYHIYWVRPENKNTLKVKEFIEQDFEKNKDKLKNKFVLDPDIKELKDDDTNINKIDIYANCINETCIADWLYKTCKDGYCIINPTTRTYYKVRGKANVMPKALKILKDWEN